MCKKLFIIGNGFDLAHQIDSRYSDFKDFLARYYPDTYEFVKYYCRPHECDWCDFEDSLGGFDPEESCLGDDVSIEEDETLRVSNMQFHAEQMNRESKMLVERFTEWIEQLNTAEYEPSQYFRQLISDRSCYFLNFNYTDTLENIYGIASENICHIHGYINDGDIPIFGHGRAPLDKSRDMTNGWGNVDQIDMINENFNSSYDRLIKDVHEIFDMHKDWFSALGTLQQIYSFGFSYNDIDMYYIQQIIRDHTIHDTVWYLNQYDEQNHKNVQYREKIESQNFTGQISIGNALF